MLELELLELELLELDSLELELDEELLELLDSELLRSRFGIATALKCAPQIRRFQGLVRRGASSRMWRLLQIHLSIEGITASLDSYCSTPMARATGKGRKTAGKGTSRKENSVSHAEGGQCGSLSAKKAVRRVKVRKACEVEG